MNFEKTFVYIREEYFLSPNAADANFGNALSRNFSDFATAVGYLE